MNVRTALNCFTLVITLMGAGFFLESIVAALKRDYRAPSLERIAPVTSLPYLSGLLSERRTREAPPARSSPSKEEAGAKDREWVTLFLKNGGKVSGELLSQEGGWVALSLEGSPVGFHASEIERIEKISTPAQDDAPPAEDRRR